MQKAYRVYKEALRKGFLVRPDRCGDCEREGSIHGHHPDYTKPLDVKWLCPYCHMSKNHTKEHRAA